MFHYRLTEKFDTCRNLQRHRAVLPVIVYGFLPVYRYVASQTIGAHIDVLREIKR